MQMCIRDSGCPGRNDLDDQQELYYPAIMRAIKDLGYKGFVAHEFMPKNGVESLYNAVKLCDVWPLLLVRFILSQTLSLLR